MKVPKHGVNSEIPQGSTSSPHIGSIYIYLHKCLIFRGNDGVNYRNIAFPMGPTVDASEIRFPTTLHICSHIKNLVNNGDKP